MSQPPKCSLCFQMETDEKSLVSFPENSLIRRSRSHRSASAVSPLQGGDYAAWTASAAALTRLPPCRQGRIPRCVSVLGLLLMELGGIPADILSQHPWFPVNISGCHLLAKSWFGDTAYHVLLTDMKCVWEERMESAPIQSRAQELNRRLRAPVRAFYSHLREIVQPCLMGSNKEPASEAQICLTRQEDGNIIMKLKSELAGLPFYWEFRCIPASVSQVCVQLVRPLLAMSRLLQHQVEQLRGLLLRKDAEIQDYKENGATLSRERLETEVFDEHTQREDFMAKALPLLCSEEQDSLGFSSELQHLYSVVTATDQRKAPKRRLSEDPPLTKESDPTPSLALEEREAAKNGRSNTGATADDRSSVKEQSVSITSNPTERLSTKPKKKKVGLFK